ncbi:MAG TPA: dihydrofolate reductase family protein [Solirubrobacteraceae bacterium]|jgi:dihydrofolate reductase|nr:dihydrofolate reductase family protein [Solirubrobacteraceae bacterium]
MRRIINSTYISLDGVIEAPHLWPSSGPGDPRGDTIQGDLLFACDALIMGRRTYEGFAPVWSARSGDPFSDHINAMPKYVASSTLRDPDWNNTTVIADDPVPAIRALKQQPGKDIVQYGFGPLTHALLAHDLLDELRLWFHPLLVGKGGPDDLLYRDNRLTKCELVDTTALSNGIVVLSYTVAR